MDEFDLFIFGFLFLILVTLIIIPVLVEIKYLYIAERFNIVSSDGKGIITGGGIVFPIVFIAFTIILLIFLYLSKFIKFVDGIDVANDPVGFHFPYFLIGFLIIATVSFIDDIRHLSPLFRLAVHFLCAWLLVEDVENIEFITRTAIYFPLWAKAVSIITCVAVINAFNFLDGIKGMTCCYAFIAFLFIGLTGYFSLLFLFPIIVVGYYNIRTPERCYLGDVGSVSLGYIFLYTLFVSNIPDSIIGFEEWHSAHKPIEVIPDFTLLTHIAVYLTDFGITLLLRIFRRENILQPHRKHLYQLLAYNCHISQVKVAIGYAAVQVVISTVFIMMPDNYHGIIAIAAAVLLSLLYFTIYRRINKIALT